MKLQQEFLNQADAWAWVQKQKQPKRGDYFIEKDIMSGKYIVWLMD